MRKWMNEKKVKGIKQEDGRIGKRSNGRWGEG